MCAEINDLDGQWIKGKRSTLNLAFLDPEGLELSWETVKTLAQVGRMDLIINFSTMGINRMARSELNSPNGKLDRFFGTDEWRACYRDHTNATQRRQAWIALYLKRLKAFGYQVSENPELESIPVHNSRGAQVYSLIFASKHPLGGKFWQSASKTTQQPKLFN
jgi:three-Cys-motif partner protein